MNVQRANFPFKSLIEKFVLTYKFIFCESFISFIIIVVVLRLLLLNTLIRTP